MNVSLKQTLMLASSITASKARTAITLIVVVIALVFSSSLSAQVLQPGEELTYSVSYIGIRLGTVRIVNEGKQEINGKPVYKCKAYIDSRDGIPFVEIHTTYESWIDPSATSSLQFVANTKESDGWAYDKYVFDYGTRTITTEKFKSNVKKSSKQFTISKKYSDGLSLFFAARQLLYSKNTATIPTLVMEDTTRTKINFTGKQEETEIDAVQYPIKTVFFNGMADWTGVYGVTGAFEGWFSDDDARIPIKAKMKLYVGNANIELVSWKRNGWQPPKAN